MKTQKEGYRQRCLKQLQNWVDGKSIHNSIDDECCPDFSCCSNVPETPVEMRRLYQTDYIQKKMGDS